jgi:hypothetical protein
MNWAGSPARQPSSSFRHQTLACGPHRADSWPRAWLRLLSAPSSSMRAWKSAELEWPARARRRGMVAISSEPGLVTRVHLRMHICTNRLAPGPFAKHHCRRPPHIEIPREAALEPSIRSWVLRFRLLLKFPNSSCGIDNRGHIDSSPESKLRRAPRVASFGSQLRWVNPTPCSLVPCDGVAPSRIKSSALNHRVRDSGVAFTAG